MGATLRIVLYTFILLATLAAVGFVYLNSLLFQALACSALLLLLSVLYKGKIPVSIFKSFLPFVLSLMAVYTFFGLLGINKLDRTPGNFLYWLSFGSMRVLLFVNTVLIFRSYFMVVRFNDLIDLPLRIGVRKYLILGKYLYNTAFNTYGQMVKLQRLIPSEQVRKAPLAHKFKSRVAVLLALNLNLLRDAREKGAQIDQRLALCHGIKPRGTGSWYLFLGFTVLVTVATLIVPIPVPGGGFFNFGDVMIVFVGLYAGSRMGALVGGIGSAIADLMLFPIFAPITLVVKGCEGFLCGMAHGRGKWLTFLFPLLGVATMVAGYFLGEWFMPQLGFATALADLPVNIVQASVGFIGGRALFELARYIDL